MSAVENQAITIAPGAGTTTWLLGDTYTLKISGAQTGGAFALLEALVPAGGVHRRTFTTPRTRLS